MGVKGGGVRSVRVGSEEEKERDWFYCFFFIDFGFRLLLKS